MTDEPKKKGRPSWLTAGLLAALAAIAGALGLIPPEVVQAVGTAANVLLPGVGQ